MNWIDGVILALGILFALFGYWRGFFQSLILLVLFGVSLAVSSRTGETVGDIFSPLTKSEDVQTLAGLGVIFLGFIIVIFALSLILTRGWKLWRHSLAFKLNRLAGAALMIAAGLVTMVGLLTASQHFPMVGTVEPNGAASQSIRGTTNRVFLSMREKKWLQHAYGGRIIQSAPSQEIALLPETHPLCQLFQSVNDDDWWETFLFELVLFLELTGEAGAAAPVAASGAAPPCRTAR